MWLAGTEKRMSTACVFGVAWLSCGQLALVIVQVLPAALSVQAVIAVVPAASEEIFAPVIAVAPAASLVIAIVALSKAPRAALVWVDVKPLPCQTSRRRMRARCDAPAAA